MPQGSTNSFPAASAIICAFPINLPCSTTFAYQLFFFTKLGEYFCGPVAFVIQAVTREAPVVSKGKCHLSLSRYINTYISLVLLHFP